MYRKTTLATMALAATIGCSPMAFAQSDLPNIDVTAQRFRENAPVAISGTDAGKEGHHLILSRSDGQLLAKIAEPTDNLGRYARLTNARSTVASKIPLGDQVTVYGRLRKMPDMPHVIAEVVADPQTGRVMLTDTGDKNLANTRLPARLKYPSFG